MSDQPNDSLPQLNLAYASMERDRTGKLQAHLTRGPLPIAWVAHSGGQPLGTAALRVHDLEGREDPLCYAQVRCCGEGLSRPLFNEFGGFSIIPGQWHSLDGSSSPARPRPSQ